MTLHELFPGKMSFSSSSKLGVAGDLIGVATDGGVPPRTTHELLKQPGNKLCLRFVTQETSEAE